MANKKAYDEQYILKLIGNNVKRFRNLQNISQLNLALSSGLAHNFIHGIENCKRGISTKTLAKLSNALNVEPHQFFLPEGSSNNEAVIYVKDFNDSLQKVVKELTQQYFAKPKKEN